MLHPAFGVMRPGELFFILANSARRWIREPSFKILDLYEYGVNQDPSPEMDREKSNAGILFHA